MARIFINNLNSYVSQAIFQELRNDIQKGSGEEVEEPSDNPNQIFGTYVDKDSSIKLDGTTKMLKRSKPRLAMNYLSQCNLLVYDLHSGNPHDVDLALQALKKYNVEEEKILIVISSLMVWNNTPPKLVEKGKENEQPGTGEEGEGGAEEEKKEEDQDKKSDKGGEHEGAEEEEEIDPETGEVKKKIKEKKEKPLPPPKEYVEVPYTEKDFKSRVPSAEYEEIKRIEDEILEFKKENVKTYVLASGIQYGKGENILNSHFKKAFLQDPVKLPFVEQGDNKVPTIHVTDLARMVKKIYEAKPDKQYVFAIDNTRNPTQKKLIQSISNGIGTGLTESIDGPDPNRKINLKKNPLQMDSDWRIPMTLNLWIKPSPLFTKLTEEQEDVDFKWHCQDGLPRRIQDIKQEFCKERGLKPIKILIAGPPASGKSFYGAQLAEHYNVPHIHARKLLEEIENWNKEKERRWNFKLERKRKQEEEERRKKEEEDRLKEQERLRIIQEKRLRGEHVEEDIPSKQPSRKQSKGDEEGEGKAEGGEKKEGEEGEANQEEKNEEDELQKKMEVQSVDDDEYREIEIKKKMREFRESNPPDTRYPEEIMNEAFRWRLEQNDCQNRGYVLDGYPKNYNTAKGVFIITPAPTVRKMIKNDEGELVPEEIDEEAEKERMKPRFQHHIYPDSVILLRGDFYYIQNRLSEKLSQEEIDKNHWGYWDLQRRTSQYTDFNQVENYQIPGSSLPMCQFFQENKTEIYELDCKGEKFEMFEGMRIYIERNGRPYNYLSSVKDLNEDREEHLKIEENDANQKKNEENKSSKDAEEKQRKELEDLADKRLKEIMKHMKDLELCDKLNMRQFLMKYIIPVLTEGMIEVCKVGPIDPVDYLSEYIFKRSVEFRDQ